MHGGFKEDQRVEVKFKFKETLVLLLCPILMKGFLAAKFYI
jgi:hypothetical protein